MINLFIQSIQETLLMVFISTLAGVFLGIPLSVLLYTTDRYGFFYNQFLNKTVGFIVNAIRSTPYIILIIALIPVTRFIAGTAIGTLAASVSLSIASIMLVCRMGEESFRTVPTGLIEAAQSMGATPLQIIRKLVIPESLPNLMAGFTLIVINLIGFSAMAGAVGGGGLGDLAIRYGYQRNNIEVTFYVVIILVLLVQIIQSTGDYLIKKLRK